MKAALLVVSLCGFMAHVMPAVAAPLDWLTPYNIIWHGQSKNSAGSMPCGGGDIGLNVWVEDDELLFYIERSGNIDENDQLLKTGRIRVRLNPNPFASGDGNTDFTQRLDLETGAVMIQGRSKTNGAAIKIWAEVHRPVVHLELETEQATAVEASFESWRNTKQLIPHSSGKDFNRWAMYGYCTYAGDVYSYADDVSFGDGRVVFFHQNGDDDLIEKEIALQRLDAVIDQMYVPTKNRVFGGVLFGENFEAAGRTEGTYAHTPFKGWTLASVEPARRHHLRLALHTEQAEPIEEWRASLDALVSEVEATPVENAWERNVAWWSDFWDRSRVVINPSRGPEDTGWQVGRNYQLMRYMLACNAYGEFPTHFNGGLFIYDHLYVDPRKGMDPAFFNADFRKWGAWTGMNQRLVHWPMLKSGDFEMMRPQFEFFRKNLRNTQLRNEVSFGIGGCSFAEQINTAGLPNGYHYGWEPPYGKRNPDHRVGMQFHHTHYFHTQLEFVFMMFEWNRFGGGDLSPYVEFMKDAVAFHFEYHMMRERERNGRDWDENGKLVMRDMQATETYKKGRNPAPEVAGLHKTLDALLSLPERWVDAPEKARLRAWKARLPELEFRVRQGRRTIAPLLDQKPVADRISNREIAQLYPVFPYGLYAVGLPDLEVALDTWRIGLDPAGDTYLANQFGKDGYPQSAAWWGWGQQIAMLARLGLTNEAKHYLSQKLSDAKGDPLSDNPTAPRFPAFWGPGYGCMPSIEWGAVGMIGVQEMLLQTLGDGGNELRLLPAWPEDWDVAFKLHAPGNTTVECRFEDGVVVETTVLPPQRLADHVVGQTAN